MPVLGLYHRKYFSMELDDIDKKLLFLLQKDAKQTHKELSIRLGLSVTAIFERIKKLEKAKVIRKYAAIVDKNMVDRGFVVFCHVKLLQHTKDFVLNFENEILKLDEVLECYHISGDYDYILKILVKDMQAYREFMVTKLTSISHIGSTHSIFMIGELKNSTVINF